MLLAYRGARGHKYQVGGMSQKDKKTDICLRFGEQLRRLRKSKGYSQEGFAHLCELDRTYISGLERGKRNITLKNMEILADTLKLSISELMDGV